jgi:hypothetical protein
MTMWPSSHGDCCAPVGVSSRATTCPRTRDRLSYCHVSLDPWLPFFTPPSCGVGSPAAMCPPYLRLSPMLPRVPRPMASFLISAPLHCSGVLGPMADFLLSTPLAGWALQPPSVPGSVAYSRTVMCPQTRGRLPYLCPLRGGLPCHHVSLNS